MPQLHELLEGEAGWLLVDQYCPILRGTDLSLSCWNLLFGEWAFPALALILFTCEQSVYSIDTKNFCATLICSARDNVFRCLCWIWEAVKLIIPAFSYQIVDCSILLPCSLSGVEVFLSRERKKIQSFSLSALVLQEMQSRGMWSLRISANSEMRIYREDKNQLEDAMHWGIADSIDFWYPRL